MITLVKTYSKFFITWVCFFGVARLVFFIYHFDSTEHISVSDFVKSFVYGLPLDISTTGYLSIIPFIFLALGALFLKQKNALNTAAAWFTYLLAFVASVLVILDCELYRNWRFKLDDTFIRYMKDGTKEVTASAGSAPYALLSVLIIGFSVMSIYVFKNWVFKEYKNPYHTQSYPLSNRVSLSALGLFITGILVLPIRGGVQSAPINQSIAYFSDKTFANHATLNPIWNFLAAYYDKVNDDKNPYLYMSDTEAQNTLNTLLKNNPSTEYLIKKDIKNPNVIVITWESLTAKAVQHLDSKESIVPNVDSLCQEGVLFSNIYASGDRTFMGMSGVLAGQPAIPGGNILEKTPKVSQLPNMGKSFKKYGYQTGFYYGGESDFASMKSYLMYGQFDYFVDKHHFKPEELTSQWGAFDHVLFERALSDLKSYKQPFFVNILTLSSHEPFEVPEGWGKPDYKPTSDIPEQFKNSLYYTDQGFGKFIAEAKKQDWWNNTLIVVIADHGTPRLPPHDDDFLNYHIPMLWIGGALAVKDTIIDKIGGQIDLSATVLAQLDIPFKDFKWSKNIMQKDYSMPFAYFTFQDGFGFMQKDVKYSWDTKGQVFRQKTGQPTEGDLKKGKAFLQLMYEDFLGFRNN